MARREALIHRTLSNPVVAQLDGKLRVAAEIKSLQPGGKQTGSWLPLQTKPPGPELRSVSNRYRAPARRCSESRTFCIIRLASILFA